MYNNAMSKLSNILLLTLIMALLSPLECSASNAPGAPEVIYAKTQKENEAQLKHQEPEPEAELKNPFDFRKKIDEALAEDEEEVSQNVNIDADEMEYFGETDELEARGNVIVKYPQNDATITADRALYNRETNVLKFFGNVTLSKADGALSGDYMVVDLNEENVLINEPIGTFSTFKITAREGRAYSGKIEAINGDMELAQKMELKIASYGFGRTIDDRIVDEKLATFEMKRKRSEPYVIETKEIIIKSNKDHDRVTLKSPSVYYKDRKILTCYTLNIHTDKGQNYFEANIPEIGSMSHFGTYFGPGFVQELPFGSTIKLIPAVVINESKMGLGAIARFRSKRNLIEGAWASSSENLILKGKYSFNDNLKFEYSRHAYMDEWFYGGRMPGYSAQLIHHKAWDVPDLKAKYTQRFTGGYVSEYSRDKQDEQDGTMRLRWQSELSKSLVSMGDREQDMFMSVNALGQVGATVYGKGNVTGLVRFGPSIDSRVKNWGSRISFLTAGVHGSSPFRFDDYRYGRSSISIDENLRLGKYLAVGYSGTISPLRDNPEEDLLTENRFYIIAGPEDVKVAVSHDVVRELTTVDFMLLFGSDSFKTKYKKLTAENPTTIAKERKPFEDLKYYKIKVPEDM